MAEKHVKLIHDSFKPLYFQLKEIFHDRIESEELKEGDTFSLLITTEHKTGALARVIKSIEKHGYNMLNIKSRPIKDVPWEYYFYIELEGNLMKAYGLLEELEEDSKYLKVLGSYNR